MSLKIEKGIPLSEFYLSRYKKRGNMTGNKGRPLKYPFKDMEVGDSFLVPLGDSGGEDRAVASKFRLLANAYAMRLNRKFLVLRDNDHKYRCWRTE